MRWGCIDGDDDAETPAEHGWLAFGDPEGLPRCVATEGDGAQAGFDGERGGVCGEAKERGDEGAEKEWCLMVTKIGVDVAFGVCEPLPLEGFPEGKVRIRMRSNNIVNVFVKTADGIMRFVPEIKDGRWHPLEVGRNCRR